MVILHIKKGDESQFLYETTCKAKLSEMIPELVDIFNGRLKIERLNFELEELGKHGITLPPNMQGLTEEQISDLKLHDNWSDKCIPSGGYNECKDPMSKRNGQGIYNEMPECPAGQEQGRENGLGTVRGSENAPLENMADVINRTRNEAQADVSKDNVTANRCLTMDIVKDAIGKLRGAVMIVYPMGLPPHDPIKQELENTEDLSGTQSSLQVLDHETSQLWWAGKELHRSKKLGDFIGKNEKTKIIAKLQKATKGQGVPGREPVFSEDDKKRMTAYAYKKQEELKKLEADEDVSYMNSNWSDPHSLKRQFQGVSNVKWRP